MVHCVISCLGVLQEQLRRSSAASSTEDTTRVAIPQADLRGHLLSRLGQGSNTTHEGPRVHYINVANSCRSGNAISTGPSSRSAGLARASTIPQPALAKHIPRGRGTTVTGFSIRRGYVVLRYTANAGSNTDQLTLMRVPADAGQTPSNRRCDTRTGT